MVMVLSRMIYGADRNRLERMFNEVLIDKVVNKKSEDNNDNIRPVQFDETNKKILLEPVVSILIDYE